VANNNKNGSEWAWRINPDQHRLQLKLSGEIVFDTCFKKAEVDAALEYGKPFSTSDAFVYSLYRDKLKTIPLTEQAQFTLAINATISDHYLKPQATKSWFFKANNEPSPIPVKQGDWVQLVTNDVALYLVLDCNESTAKIMLVGREHSVDDTRVFQRGKVLRVHSDRLRPVMFKIQEDML
jgi:hypothetical protein